MPRPVHFQIPVVDLEASRAFYESVFDWKFTPYGEGFYFVTTGVSPEPGIDGVIMKRREARDPMTNSISVDSIDEYCAKIEASGGIIVVPKQAVPTMGYLAYFRDPEGNVQGLWETDRSAK